jgi:hypothetical protein
MTTTTEEMTVTLTPCQWRKIGPVLMAEARRLGIVPDDAVSMGITTEWGEDTPSLVFDVKSRGGAA